jgi:hypothetical protein
MVHANNKQLYQHRCCVLVLDGARSEEKKDRSGWSFKNKY